MGHWYGPSGAGAVVVATFAGASGRPIASEPEVHERLLPSVFLASVRSMISQSCDGASTRAHRAPAPSPLRARSARSARRLTIRRRMTCASTRRYRQASRVGDGYCPQGRARLTLEDARDADGAVERGGEENADLVNNTPAAIIEPFTLPPPSTRSRSMPTSVLRTGGRRNGLQSGGRSRPRVRHSVS